MHSSRKRLLELLSGDDPMPAFNRRLVGPCSGGSDPWHCYFCYWCCSAARSRSACTARRGWQWAVALGRRHLCLAGRHLPRHAALPAPRLPRLARLAAGRSSSPRSPWEQVRRPFVDRAGLQHRQGHPAQGLGHRAAGARRRHRRLRRRDLLRHARLDEAARHSADRADARGAGLPRRADRRAVPHDRPLGDPPQPARDPRGGLGLRQGARASSAC